MAWKRRMLIFVPLLILVILMRLSPVYYGIRSVVVMWPYSRYHESMSLIKQHDFHLKMPTDSKEEKDRWYPLMLVFQDSNGFSNWTGGPWDLTVLYRFGGFELLKKNAAYFDRESSRFSSFYGAYLIRNTDESGNIYGYDESGQMIPEDFMRVTEYDQRFLVMPSLGLSHREVVFEVDMLEKQQDVTYLQRESWTRVDALIKTNSPEHHYAEHQQGYLQYGLPLPPPKGKNDFYPVTLYGRIYATVIESHDLTLALYILAPDQKTLEEVDSRHLSRTEISY